MHSESKGQESEEINDAERIIRLRGSEGSRCSVGSKKCGVLLNGVLDIGHRTAYSLGLSSGELDIFSRAVCLTWASERSSSKG